MQPSKGLNYRITALEKEREERSEEDQRIQTHFKDLEIKIIEAVKEIDKTYWKNIELDRKIAELEKEAAMAVERLDELTWENMELSAKLDEHMSSDHAADEEPLEYIQTIEVRVPDARARKGMRTYRVTFNMGKVIEVARLWIYDGKLHSHVYHRRSSEYAQAAEEAAAILKKRQFSCTNTPSTRDGSGPTLPWQWRAMGK